MSDLWPLVRLFFLSLGMAFTGALMPGPMLVVTAVHAHRRGWTAGPLVVLGHGTLEIALILAVILGLGPYMERPTLVGILGLGGGIVLAVMGGGMLLASRTVELTDPAAAGQSAARTGFHRGAFVAGIWSSLINPYWSIWWLSAGLALVTQYAPEFGVGLAVFFVGHILADLIWFTFVSVSFSKGKAYISRRAFRRLVLLGGLVLVVFALLFGYFGAKTLHTGEYRAAVGEERPAE